MIFINSRAQALLKENRIRALLKENRIPTTVNAPVPLDLVFHTNIIACCQQNWYIRFAIYTDLSTLFFSLQIKHIISVFPG